jgi:hypothetical protein
MKAAATERRDDGEIKSLGSDLLNVDFASRCFIDARSGIGRRK